MVIASLVGSYFNHSSADNSFRREANHSCAYCIELKYATLETAMQSSLYSSCHHSIIRTCIIWYQVTIPCDAIYLY